jgi:hypothetical protein
MVLPLILFRPFLQALVVMFAVNIHENGVSALMQNKSYILQSSLNPREKNLIYNWHMGEDEIPFLFGNYDLENIVSVRITVF